MNKHPFQSLCSYIGGFPPQVARDLICDLAGGSDPVLDPFCGSGTTLLEAKRRGLECMGVDLNPLAVALSKAKVADVTQRQVNARLSSLAANYNPPADRIAEDDPIRIIYHDRTLRQLAYLKTALEVDRPADRFLQGALLGIMHGKFRQDGSTQYLSIDMPNTFSMSPSYVRDYVEEHGLMKKPIDVFGKLRSRVDWLFRDGGIGSKSETRVFQWDATELDRLWKRMELPPVSSVVTSPPYLKVLRYGSFNWIRLWFLDESPSEIDAMLDTTGSLEKYLSFIASFLVSLGSVVRQGAPVALVVGDVATGRSAVDLADRIHKELGDLVPFEYVGIIEDDFDTSSKTTRIWGEGKKGRATKQDRILVLERS